MKSKFAKDVSLFALLFFCVIFLIICWKIVSKEFFISAAVGFAVLGLFNCFWLLFLRNKEKIIHYQRLEKSLLKQKTLREYLNLKETSFIFDPEDENRIMSRKNINLAIRVSRGKNLDEVIIGFSSSFFEENTAEELKEKVSELEIVQMYKGKLSIKISKGSGSKWTDFGQKLIEVVIQLYEKKYETEWF